MGKPWSKTRPVPPTPLGRRARRIYETYPQYFESPKEVYDMLRWSAVEQHLTDEQLVRMLLERKGIRVDK